MIDDADADAPRPTEFADQLILQLTRDLDGILFDGETAVDDAFALLAREAAAGAARGATLVLLIRAALAAHRVLTYEAEGYEPPDDAALAETLVELIPDSRAQRSTLLAQADRLERILALARFSHEPATRALFVTIVRFYEGLRQGDESLAGRALIELRSMVVHIDATTSALESTSFEPRRVLRPDRFHDWFMQYASLAQKPEAHVGEQAVATLTRDGRISAVVTADLHPLDAAAQTVRELIPEDEITRDHALARIRALLEFIDSLRQRQQQQIGDVQNDPTVYLSLVVAAATAPLDAAGGFRLGSLGQLARYNQQLLRGNSAAPRPTAH